MDRLKNFFASSKTLIIAFLFFLYSWLMNRIVFLSETNIYYLNDFMFALVIALFISFVFNESNIQKALISGIYVLAISITLNNVSFKNAESVIILILWIVSYIIYLLLQSDKIGNSNYLSISHIVLISFFIFTIADIIIKKDIINNLIRLSLLLLLICVQTKIHVYKEIRYKCKKEGTWTEEEKTKAKNIFKI